MSKKSVIDIDDLLQDTWLLVVQLRQGVPVEHGQTLWQHCTKNIERTEQTLKEAGMHQSAIDHIRYAQCALLDETVLGRPQDDGYFAWHAMPLQAHFFQTLQAGELLYQRMREVLREPAPNMAVLTCFHRVLMLGFRGVYGENDTPERQQLVAELSQRVAPLDVDQSAPLLVNAAASRRYRWLHSRWVHVVAAVVILAGVWWGFHSYLTTLVTTLLPAKP
ncbi:type VI secretion system protein TssL, short form [Hafnia alvei]|uniref:type VI secretion system protein TssL, short form n=1 Tax=Hafnia alvei TaxID=569 RepID=UPI00266C6DF4|nr:type VI secretion system protein TssL, short form [Hafnia alvei]